MSFEIHNVIQKRVGNQIYYFGTVSSNMIKSITYVPVIEKSSKTYLIEKIEGYQRPGSRSRMRQFMRFLEENPNCIVPPILLSGRDWCEFKLKNSDFLIGTLLIYQPVAIIDGQHRVGGYIALYEEKGIERPVDFILIEGLNVDTESKEFLVVNTTQKGVPKPLTAYIEGEESAMIAWALNEEEDSPFKGRITRTTMGKNHLFTLHSVAKEIEKMFSHGKLQDFDEDTKIDILIRYWTIIADEFPEEWSDIEKLDNSSSKGRNSFDYKILELTGFIAWSRIGAEILARSYVDEIGIDWDNVRQLVRTVGNVDWRKDGQYAHKTGLVGAGLIHRDMQRLMPPAVSIASD